LRVNDPQAFCERICLKIGHYLLVLYKKELLHMNVDFFQDDNGFLWLFLCRDIVIREPVIKDNSNTTQSKLKSQPSKEIKEKKHPK
jgi:hypothetical protein